MVVLLYFRLESNEEKKKKVKERGDGSRGSTQQSGTSHCDARACANAPGVPDTYPENHFKKINLDHYAFIVIRRRLIRPYVNSIWGGTHPAERHIALRGSRVR